MPDSAKGDAGARVLLAEHAADLVLVPCDAIADPRDPDTPADLSASTHPPRPRQSSQPC